MTIKSVGFQLKTDGKAQVKNDFAEIRSAGASAFVGVADAAEAANDRAARASEAFTARQIEGFRKAATAAKLAAAAANDRSTIDAALAMPGNGAQFATVNLDRSSGAAKAAADVFRPLIEAEEQMELRTRALITAIDPAWAAQERYNASMREARELLDLGRISAEQYGLAQTRAQAQLDAGTGATKRAEIAAAALTSMQARVSAAGDNGFGGWEGSAERSASAFRQLLVEEEKLERRANALRAAIDPATAAQQRFDAEMAEARSLISQGAISLDEYVGKLKIEQSALDQVTGSRGRLNGANGQARQSSIMLGQQLQDFSVQVSNGGSIATAFSQQIGQAAFAVQGMGGKLEGVGNFLTSPWGIAATIGATVLAPLVAKILAGNDALDDAVDKMKKDAAATDVTRDAKLRFARSIEGVSSAIRDQRDAQLKAIEADKGAAEQDNINAKRELARQIRIREITVALLEQAEAEAKAANSTSFGAAGGAGAGMAQGIYAGRTEDARKAAEKAKADLVLAQANVAQSRIDLAAEAATRATDPMAKIKKQYDDQVAAAERKARAEGTVTAELTRQLTQIQRNRDAAIKTEQERESASKAKPTNQVGRNITLAESRGIVEGIGGRVTSDHRTFEEQQKLYAKYVAYKSGTGPWAALAAKPGTSNHELDQALDVAKSGGVTLAKLIAAYRQAGVRLVEALDEGDHYHVAWKKTGAAAREATQERTDAAKKVREEAAAQRELKQDLDGVVKAYDPARSAAEEYAATLAKIQNLVGKGKLTIDDAAAYSATARIQFLTGQSERFAAQFKTLFGGEGDPLKDIIDGSDRQRAQQIADMTDADAARTKILAANFDEVRSYGASFVDTVLSEDTWSSWGNAGKTVLNSLKGEFIKLALLNPLKNLINGNSNLPTLTKALGSLGSLFGGKSVTAPTIGPPGNATGTESWSGGMTWVNENGGEIMDLPTGTRIYPAAESRRMMQAANDGGSRGGDKHYHFSGNLLTPEWWQQIQAGDANAAMQGAAGGAAMGQADAQAAGVRRLGRFR